MDRNKAIEVLKDFWSVYAVGTEIREAFETLIPEIKESEDERIRKGLIKAVSGILKGNTLFGTDITREEALSWLEKQGGQKKDDKVEPKFKVGDFIVNDYCMGRVIEITNDSYLLDTGQGILFSCHSTRLWDITKDAKDGDVLTVEDVIFIKERTIAKHIVSYCKLINGIFESTIDARTCCEGNTYVHPATKEQRDILFQKMEEAGYNWDAEKKELRKIEQKPSIKDELFDHRYAQYSVESQRQKSMIQWKGDNLKEVIDFTGKDKNFDKWFKSFEEYEQYVQKHNGIFKLFNTDGSHYEVPVGAWIVKTPDGCNVASKAIFKQNPTWSEEDEKMLQSLESIVKDYWAKAEEKNNKIKIREASDALFFLKTIQKSSLCWIKCLERLPNRDGTYLVVTDGRHNDVYDIARYDSTEGWHKASEIIYWMPMPKLD